jgi:sulfatase maturation enzyme AslB (radical SAM superfamily)
MGSQELSAGDRANGFYSSEYVEFTLAIGCPLNCMKYCPQEVLLKNYGKSTRMMSLESFKTMLSHIPKRVLLDFSGFCEPCVNPSFADMVKYASQEGYRIHIATTLQGASDETVDKLLGMQYEGFVLHLPDGKYANFNLTPQYKENVFRVMQGIPNLQFISMNDMFVSNNRENLCRGIYPKSRRVGFCRKTSTPQLVVMPDGRVQACDMDFALQYTLGNLLEDDYVVLVKRFKAQRSSYKLCHYCPKYYSADRVIIRKVAGRLGYFNRSKWM